MHRVERLAAHLAPEHGQQRGVTGVRVNPTSSLGRSPDDVVICSAVRTPICKAKRGSFKDTAPDVLMTAVMKAAVDRAGCPVDALGDIVMGNVLLQQAPIYMRQVGFQYRRTLPSSVGVHIAGATKGVF